MKYGKLPTAKFLFNFITKDSARTEKYIQVAILALKKTYMKGEVRGITWIPGSMNAADALTKDAIGYSSPLWRLMKTNTSILSDLGSAVVSSKKENARV